MNQLEKHLNKDLPMLKEQKTSGIRQLGFRGSQSFWVVLLALLLSLHSVDFLFGQSQEVKPQTNSDWPGFLGTHRNSKSIETGILTDWSAGKLKIVWRANVGAGYVLGSVAKQRFFQFDAKESTCRLTCRDATTGEEKWDYSYDFEYQDMYGFDNGPRATPIIDGQYVYIYGVEGMLHCLDIDSRKVVWKVDVNKQFGVVQNFFGVGSSPIIVGNHLVVMVGGSPASDLAKSDNKLDQVSSNGTGIVVFDKRNGHVVSKFGDDLASYSSVQTYQNEGKTYGLAWMRGNLLGFDIAGGTTLWRFPFRARKYESVNAMTPVVSGTQVFLSECYGPGSVVLDVGGNQPRVVWRDSNPRTKSMALHWNSPVLHDGHLYASHGADRGNAELRCVEFATGRVKWKQKGYGRASITFVDGRLVVLDENADLLLVDATPEKFNLVTKYSTNNSTRLPLNHPCWAAPVIANGKLYVRGKLKILCLDLKPDE